MNRFSIHTQFVGQQLLEYPVCPSTNTEALRLVSDNKVQDGAVIMADHQTAGRGQRGSHWEAEPGQNLTFSVVFYPDLAVSRQFYLNIIASLAVAEALTSFTSQPPDIKWPNDILYAHHKLCGILIQNNLKSNKIQSAVIGIGINVNQIHFSYPKVTSLALIGGKTFDRSAILSDLLCFLEKRYLQLKNQAFSDLKQEYLQRLYWRDETRWFADQAGEFRGILQDVTEEGQLQVSVQGQTRYYNFKEIRYIG